MALFQTGTSGSVGVNVAFPTTYSLQVSSTIGATGDIVAYYSDSRLKTKTGTLDGALDKICSLDTFTYVPNELAKTFGYTDSKERLGLNAQEVQKVAPQVVCIAPFDSETIDGVEKSKSGQDYLTVQYERLIPMLVQALKEERRAREALENMIVTERVARENLERRFEEHILKILV